MRRSDSLGCAILTAPRKARGYAVDALTGEAVTISVGAVKLRERAKPKGDPEFGPKSFGRLRVKKINRLMDYRYPDGLPEVDIDDDAFLFCVAHAMYVGRRSEVEYAAKLHAWIETRMPWARGLAQQLVDKFQARFNPRSDHLAALTVARILCVTESERRALKLSTIGIAGMTDEQYGAWLVEERKCRDRERKAKARTEAGSLPREEWLKANSTARERPWDGAGIGRTEYYDRLRLERTGHSNHERTGCSVHERTGCSTPIESTPAMEQPVRNAAPAPSISRAETVADAVNPPVLRRVTTCRKPASVDQLSLFSDEASS